MNQSNNRETRAANRGEKIHYLKALMQYFNTREAPGFMDILRNGDMLHDHDRPMDWFGSSAGGNGSTKAMFKMGDMYYSGGSVVQDHGKALEWYLAASEAGNPSAIVNIGNMYDKGLRVEQDGIRALDWYFRASDAGDSSARFNIDNLYVESLGVKQDFGKAHDRGFKVRP
ncbi:hypothetical protein BGZ67_001817 [Mortierella alpina]|nr:hypothetical protein BGZ67_001817 [Mortierella alpina]